MQARKSNMGYTCVKRTSVVYVGILAWNKCGTLHFGLSHLIGLPTTAIAISRATITIFRADEGGSCCLNVMLASANTP